MANGMAQTVHWPHFTDSRRIASGIAQTVHWPHFADSHSYLNNFLCLFVANVKRSYLSILSAIGFIQRERIASKKKERKHVVYAAFSYQLCITVKVSRLRIFFGQLFT